jgi:hypothetical protein
MYALGMYAFMYVCNMYVYVRMCVFCLKEARGPKLIFMCAYLAFHSRSKFETPVNDSYTQISGWRRNLEDKRKRRKDEIEKEYESSKISI